MAYTGDDIKDLDETTPDGSVETVAILDNAIREVKKTLKYQYAIEAFTGADTLASDNTIALCDASGGAFALALPTASTVASSTYTKFFLIMKTDSSANAVTITGTVNGVSNPTLSKQYQCALIWTDGTSWYSRDVSQQIVGATLTSPVLTTPQINDTSADHQYVFAVSELAADRTVTLPLLTGNDTFTFNDFAQALKNKTFDTALTLNGNCWPSFSVNKGGTNQTSVGTAKEIITWSTEIFDTNNNFASNRFTPTVAGKYLLSASLRFLSDAATDTLEIAIYKNGALLHNNVWSVPYISVFNMTITAVVDANGSGDYFEIYGANASTASTVYGAADLTFFTGCRIG